MLHMNDSFDSCINDDVEGREDSDNDVDIDEDDDKEDDKDDDQSRS